MELVNEVKRKLNDLENRLAELGEYDKWIYINTDNGTSDCCFRDENRSTDLLTKLSEINNLLNVDKIPLSFQESLNYLEGKIKDIGNFRYSRGILEIEIKIKGNTFMFDYSYKSDLDGLFCKIEESGVYGKKQGGFYNRIDHDFDEKWISIQELWDEVLKIVPIS